MQDDRSGPPERPVSARATLADARLNAVANGLGPDEAVEQWLTALHMDEPAYDQWVAHNSATVRRRQTRQQEIAEARTVVEQDIARTLAEYSELFQLLNDLQAAGSGQDLIKRVKGILAGHEAAIARMRAVVAKYDRQMAELHAEIAAEWRASASASRNVSEALGSPVQVLVLASAREHTSTSHRVRATPTGTSKPSSDDPEPAPGLTPARLAHLERLLERDAIERRELLDEVRALGARLAARAWRERRAAA